MISPHRVQCSWGALGIGQVEELSTERIAIVSMKGSGIQYLFVSRSAQPPVVFLSAYVWGREKMRGLLISHEGLELAPTHDWLGELRASELESERSCEP
jgi:hypothetical protein